MGTARVLGGRYRLLHRLGTGGMGEVWAAEHEALKSRVAVKILDPKIATSKDKQARFFREARAAAALSSPHVVRVFDFGVDGETPYIAMELLEGETLSTRLTREGSLSPAVVADILTQVGRAVAEAHDLGIVHRDLKPDNIFLVRNQEEVMAKVLDFGVAKLTTDNLQESIATQTVAGAMMGTPYYMSPEQVKGTTVDGRTDVWALGVIAFQCLTGKVPFQGDSLGSLVYAICKGGAPAPSSVARVPDGFDAWFLRTTQRKKSQRFASFKTAVEALREVCDGAAASSRAASSGSAGPAPVGRRSFTDSDDMTRIDARPPFEDDDEVTRLARPPTDEDYDDDEVTRLARGPLDQEEDDDEVTRLARGKHLELVGARPRPAAGQAAVAFEDSGDQRLGRLPPTLDRDAMAGEVAAVPSASHSSVPPPRVATPGPVGGRSQTWDEDDDMDPSQLEAVRRRALLMAGSVDAGGTADDQEPEEGPGAVSWLWLVIGLVVLILLGFMVGRILLG